VRIAAIVCARDEAVHIGRCLDNLIADGIEVILIDHSSQDSTVEIARKYLGCGLLAIEKLPWLGHFSLRQQLMMKRAIIRGLDHDWVLHIDADEWFCAPDPDQSLVEAIRQVDREGFTCVNFEEMVFMPWPEDDFVGEDYTRRMTTYYFYEPSCMRLMRAWSRRIDADNVFSAGHKLRSDRLKIYPQSFINRHYIMLSYDHGRHKYGSRRFDEAELVDGWHCNRARINGNDLVLKPSLHLRRLSSWDSGNFDRSAPATRHFWEWQSDNSAASESFLPANDVLQLSA